MEQSRDSCKRVSAILPLRGGQDPARMLLAAGKPLDSCIFQAFQKR